MERQQGSSEQPGMVGLGKDGLRISPTDPLDAVAEDGRRPWKLVWNPETGEVVHCRPSEDHQFALIRTGKPANWPQEFERWLRVTFNWEENLAGSRHWHLLEMDWKARTPDELTEMEKRSHRVQLAAYRFFAKGHPGLRWAFDLHGRQLVDGTSERLEGDRLLPDQAFSSPEQAEQVLLAEEGRPG
jgi:hypothetical protein